MTGLTHLGTLSSADDASFSNRNGMHGRLGRGKPSKNCLTWTMFAMTSFMCDKVFNLSSYIMSRGFVTSDTMFAYRRKFFLSPPLFFIVSSFSNFLGGSA